VALASKEVEEQVVVLGPLKLLLRTQLTDLFLQKTTLSFNNPKSNKERTSIAYKGNRSGLVAVGGDGDVGNDPRVLPLGVEIERGAHVVDRI